MRTVGRCPLDVPDRGVGVAGLGNHLDVGLGLEQEAQRASNHDVIVGEHDRDRLTLLPPPPIWSSSPQLRSGREL